MFYFLFFVFINSLIFLFLLKKIQKYFGIIKKKMYIVYENLIGFLTLSNLKTLSCNGGLRNSAEPFVVYI